MADQILQNLPFLNRRYSKNLVLNYTKSNSVKVSTTSDRANSGEVPSSAWWVGRIQEDSRRHQFLSFVGRRAPNRWSLGCYKSQTADLFTIHSTTYFEEVMTHHMLKLPVLHFRWRKGDRIQKSGFFNFLCALLASFSSLSSLYISVTNSCLLIFFLAIVFT